MATKKELIAQAVADREKANADWLKANADREKARKKANAELVKAVALPDEEEA